MGLSDQHIATLRSALSLPREREKLLRLEDELVRTVHDKAIERLEMQPMSSYDRTLVQALADIYGFEFHVQAMPMASAAVGGDRAFQDVMAVTVEKEAKDAMGSFGLNVTGVGKVLGVVLRKTPLTAVPEKTLAKFIPKLGLSGGKTEDGVTEIRHSLLDANIKDSAASVTEAGTVSAASVVVGGNVQLVK